MLKQYGVKQKARSHYELLSKTIQNMLLSIMGVCRKETMTLDLKTSLWWTHYNYIEIGEKLRNLKTDTEGGKGQTQSTTKRHECLTQDTTHWIPLTSNSKAEAVHLPEEVTFICSQANPGSTLPSLWCWLTWLWMYLPLLKQWWKEGEGLSQRTSMNDSRTWTKM